MNHNDHVLQLLVGNPNLYQWHHNDPVPIKQLSIKCLDHYHKTIFQKYRKKKQKKKTLMRKSSLTRFYHWFCYNSMNTDQREIGKSNTKQQQQKIGDTS